MSANAMAFGNAFNASLVASTSSWLVETLVTRAWRIPLFCYSLRSNGLSSWQRYIKVVRDASLMFMFGLFDVPCRLVIKSFHSLRGISIEPIVDKTCDTDLLTKAFGDARVANTAVLTWCLNSVSRFIQ